jgi:plastocyanin
MHPSFRRMGIAFSGIVLCATLLTACGSTNSTSNAVATTPTPINGTIIIDAETQLFMPFITVVDVNAQVTFTNNDTTAHDVKSVPLADPSQANFLNPTGSINQTVQGGATKKLTFTKPGLYDLYDDTQATIDKTYHRVAANKNAAGFPYAAEAVIWVKGTITGLPKTTKNSIIAANDAFQFDFVAVATNGTGIWHNFDVDAHYVSITPSFAGLNPAKVGDNVNRVLGTDGAPPKGADLSLTFTTPGLYYYYCAAHANFDTTLNRVNAHYDTSIFPLVMEGFVLVG